MRLQQLEKESEQLDVSFQSYLHRQHILKHQMNADASKIWENYNLSKASLAQYNSSNENINFMLSQSHKKMINVGAIMNSTMIDDVDIANVLKDLEEIKRVQSPQFDKNKLFAQENRIKPSKQNEINNPVNYNPFELIKNKQNSVAENIYKKSNSISHLNSVDSNFVIPVNRIEKTLAKVETNVNKVQWHSNDESKLEVSNLKPKSSTESISTVKHIPKNDFVENKQLIENKNSLNVGNAMNSVENGEKAKNVFQTNNGKEIENVEEENEGSQKVQSVAQTINGISDLMKTNGDAHDQKKSIDFPNMNYNETKLNGIASGDKNLVAGKVMENEMKSFIKPNIFTKLSDSDEMDSDQISTGAVYVSKSPDLWI